MASVSPRKGMPDVTVDRQSFDERFRQAFNDPLFGGLDAEIAAITHIAWEAYSKKRKAPRTQKAGSDFSDPDYDVATEWLNTRGSIAEAQKRHEDRRLPSRILLINGSPRSEHTCPGEMSKTFRLVETAKVAVENNKDFVADVLDLIRLTSEYGRQIYPCKACFSTSPALCHWPCSCYPNHGLGQINDWMNEIYPLWVAAHGIMIVTPCHWYQAPTTLKSMIDRLVCADGGNTDPTLTHGKNAEEAKHIELGGWSYPKHLAGRAFSIIVHGDSEGADVVRRSLHDWLSDMQLRPAGTLAAIDRYIGYYRPYATSHEDLDGDAAIFEETRNATYTLLDAVKRYRSGEMEPGARLQDPRPK
ncbi:flavodoxin family protein [Hyphomicrobium sp. MC8b]|uniref:flavodoxin family protein n=1 Tax=Hyphomicrobium sp. MC8b TaxID=300273 RepID=UPI00391D7B0D